MLTNKPPAISGGPRDRTPQYSRNLCNPRRGSGTRQIMLKALSNVTNMRNAVRNKKLKPATVRLRARSENSINLSRTNALLSGTKFSNTKLWMRCPMLSNSGSNENMV